MNLMMSEWLHSQVKNLSAMTCLSKMTYLRIWILKTNSYLLTSEIFILEFLGFRLYYGEA